MAVEYLHGHTQHHVKTWWFGIHGLSTSSWVHQMVHNIQYHCPSSLQHEYLKYFCEGKEEFQS